jgi:hypothetical protein
MDVSTLSQLTNNAGSAVGVQLLNQAQDIATQQANQLVNSIPQAPANLPGVGEKVDLTV